MIRNTLREEIFAGINFHEFFSGHFVGINFRKLGFTEDFAGINVRKLSVIKDFAGTNFSQERPLQRFRESKFNICLEEKFVHDLSLWF